MQTQSQCGHQHTCCGSLASTGCRTARLGDCSHCCDAIQQILCQHYQDDTCSSSGSSSSSTFCPEEGGWFPPPPASSNIINKLTLTEPGRWSCCEFVLQKDMLVGEETTTGIVLLRNRRSTKEFPEKLCFVLTAWTCPTFRSAMDSL